MRRKIIIKSFLAVFLLCCQARADYKDDVGFSKLTGILSNTIPLGIGISVTQIEALEGTNYMPDISSNEFTGKIITNCTSSSDDISGHATLVGRYFYGTNTSMAPGITNISVYSANNWLADGFLNTGTFFPPLIETNRIQNHSWISYDSNYTNPICRFDYAIDRDNFVAVVALNNGSTNIIPELLAYSYNSICVGLSSGQHSALTNQFGHAERTKPEIVAPETLTSLATPTVGSACALLLETADKDAMLVQARKSQCIKAILMAGATKNEFPSWSRTSLRPLDRTYGAGELNVCNSYYILKSGQQSASTTNLVPAAGWDYRSIGNGSNLTYFFQVPESNVLSRFSAALVWNRQITNSSAPYFDPLPYVANLDLRLYSASNLTIESEIDASTSIVDNVEYIYRRNMPAGNYALKISSDTTTNFALAWFGTTALIPEFRGIVLSNNFLSMSSFVSVDIPYGVRATTNLADTNSWIWIATNTSASNVMLFTDTNSTNLPRRFYQFIIDP